MQLTALRYDNKAGWSVAPFPALDSPQTLVIVFGSTEFLDDPAAIAELATAYPSSHFVGCSSSGEIFGSKVFDGTLSCAVARFQHTRLATASATVTQAGDSFAAGQALAAQLAQAGEDLRAVLVLSDGLHVNGSELVKGVNGGLPTSVVVTGGLAGDRDRFSRTWVLNRSFRPEECIVSAVGFYGDKVVIGHGSKGGWDNFGPERLITRSKSNVLFELDGAPALKLYRDYLGERASGLPATGLLFPLAIRRNDRDEKRLVRTILAINEAEQSMTFAGDVPEGYRAQLMKANFDRLIGGASDAAQAATERVTDRKPASGETLALAISCVGRRLVLGERTEEEVEATLDMLPKGTRQVGFYSYGEISPYTTGACDLHNQTMTLTTISELEV